MEFLPESGQDGPRAQVAGHDANYIGYAGVLGIIGEDGRRPAIPGVQIGDLAGGGMAAVIAEHEPEVVAIERLFFNSNVKTAMAVGQASGVALAAAAQAGLKVHEYTPPEVKQSVAGVGGASKLQVQTMVASPAAVASLRDSRAVV